MSRYLNKPHRMFWLPLLLACWLPGRSVIAQVTSTWNNTTGNWTDATKWSTDPDFPNNGNGGFDYNAVIGGGTVTLDQDITVEGFTLSGGTLTADSSFTLTLNAASTWSGGTMEGAGQTTISSGGALAINQPATHNLNRQLVNDGATTWTGSNALAFTGGTFTNNGSFTADSSSFLDGRGISGTNAFNNVGTFTKIGDGQAVFRLYTASGVAFNNSGTVDVQEGTLVLQSGGTHTGDFTGLAGGTLELGGDHTLAAGADVTGGVSLLVSSGASIDNGLINTSGAVTFDGGSITVNGTVSAGTLAIGGGAGTLNNTTTASSLNLSSGTLGGSGNVTLSGSSTWSGGTMEGAGQTTISSGGALAINQPATHNLNRQLVNDGATTWTGSNALAFTGGTFTNNGSFTADSSSFLDGRGISGTNAFNNVGTFTKIGDGQAVFRLYTASGVAFNNSGTVDVQEGTLSLEGGGSGNGQFLVSPGASLRFVGTGFNYTGGVTLSGGTLQLTSYSLEAGTVQGTGTIDATTFTNASEVSPGITGGDEIGSLLVDGEYVQEQEGNLTMDVTGINPGENDTFQVTGEALLEGSLTVEITGGAVQAGDSIQILTAKSITEDLSSFEVVGDDDLFFALSIEEIAPNLFALSMDGFEEGDMNRDGGPPDVDDVAVFALALTDPLNYRGIYRVSAKEAGDLDDDGDIDVDDIDDFADLLNMSVAELTGRIADSANVPEPTSLTFAVLGTVLGMTWRQKRA